MEKCARSMLQLLDLPELVSRRNSCPDLRRLIFSYTQNGEVCPIDASVALWSLSLQIPLVQPPLLKSPCVPAVMVSGPVVAIATRGLSRTALNGTPCSIYFVRSHISQQQVCVEFLLVAKRAYHPSANGPSLTNPRCSHGSLTQVMMLETGQGTLRLHVSPGPPRTFPGIFHV